MFISLLQHKKLAEGSAYEEVSTSTPYSENDISNSIKNGILYLEDPINHVSMLVYSANMNVFLLCPSFSLLHRCLKACLCFERLVSEQDVWLLNI